MSNVNYHSGSIFITVFVTDRLACNYLGPEEQFTEPALPRSIAHNSQVS